MFDIAISVGSIISSVLSWSLLLYFIYTVSYSLVLSIAAFFYRSPTSSRKSNVCKIVVLIPAYKEDWVIVDAAQQAINHDYPEDKFDVVVIADSLQM